MCWSTTCRVNAEPSNTCSNMLDCQLIALPASKAYGRNWSVSHCNLQHISPQCRHIPAKQRAHITRAKRTFWSLSATCRCIAHNSAYQGARFQCASTVWYAVISRATQNHTVMRCWLFPTMQCETGSLIQLVTGDDINCELTVLMLKINVIFLWTVMPFIYPNCVGMHCKEVLSAIVALSVASNAPNYESLCSLPFYKTASFQVTLPRGISKFLRPVLYLSAKVSF